MQRGDVFASLIGYICTLVGMVPIGRVRSNVSDTDMKFQHVLTERIGR
jgi:hypothetical protein